MDISDDEARYTRTFQSSTQYLKQMKTFARERSQLMHVNLHCVHHMIPAIPAGDSPSSVGI